MRHQHDRFGVRLPDAQQFDVQAVASKRIERAERLVHQQHARVGDQRLTDRDALLHAARQLVRIALRELFEPER